MCDVYRFPAVKCCFEPLAILRRAEHPYIVPRDVMKSYMERRSSCRVNVVPVLLQLARNRPAISNISLHNLRRAANEELGVQQAIELVPDRLL